MKKTNKSILKIVIFSFLVLLIFSIVRTFIFYNEMKTLALSDAKKDALLIKDYMMSMRKVFISQFLESGIPLNKKTIGFLPAHASSKISDEFIKTNAFNFYIRNVSDQPRNPKNLADQEELKAIEYFKNNPTKEEYSNIYTNNEGENILQFATPILTQESCLTCHGNKNQTLPIVQNLYKNAYGYKVGELRGVVSLKIPEKNIFTNTKQFFIKELTMVILSLTLISFILIFVYKNTTKKIKKINDDATEIALTDALTGIHNRHYLNQFIDTNCTNFKPTNNNYVAVAFLDIDHFKAVNDTYGHEIGDYVLQVFAKKLEELTRKEDILCRYGGEEFVIIIKDISKSDAIKKMEEIRKSIETMPLESSSNLKHITVSIGLVFGKTEPIKELVTLADHYLYQAKEQGRNQIKHP